ncbi:hypothetical protein ACLB2K_043637 [Fragaria x ananassa]
MVDGVVVVSDGDAEDVDRDDEAVDYAEAALDADDGLAAGGGEWIVDEGGDGVSGGVRGDGRRGGGGENAAVESGEKGSGNSRILGLSLLQISKVVGFMDDNGLRFSESNYYDSVENEEVQSEEEDLEDEQEETLVSNSVDTQNCLHYKRKRYEDLRYEDLKEVDFESVEEVDTFYSFYSLAMGFSFRKEKLDKNIYGIVVRRQLVCSKEGTRKKKGAPKDR